MLFYLFKGLEVAFKQTFSEHSLMSLVQYLTSGHAFWGIPVYLVRMLELATNTSNRNGLFDVFCVVYCGLFEPVGVASRLCGGGFGAFGLGHGV